MINVLTDEQVSKDVSAVDWTPQTLQRLVHLGSVKESCAILTDLSSAALHNLLVLVELNVRALLKDEVVKFVENIDTLRDNDEWCEFLIQRLKRSVGGSVENRLLVSMQGDESLSPEIMEEGTMEQGNDVEMRDLEEESSPEVADTLERSPVATGTCSSAS